MSNLFARCIWLLLLGAIFAVGESGIIEGVCVGIGMVLVFVALGIGLGPSDVSRRERNV